MFSCRIGIIFIELNLVNDVTTSCPSNLEPVLLKKSMPAFLIKRRPLRPLARERIEA